MSTRAYNTCLDFLKGIACIFVVLMHCEFPGTLGTVVQAVSRFCVPFFFMVSGYYCFKLKDGQEVRDPAVFRRKLGHIARIILGVIVFYVLFAVVQNLIWHDTPLGVKKSEVLMLVLFNEPFIIAGQMWFLFALLYDYVLIYFVKKWNLTRAAYVFAAVMAVLYVVLAQGAHLMGDGIPVPEAVVRDFGGNIPHLKGGRVPVPTFIYRNFLIEGFAFFMLGHWIHEHQDRISVSNKTLLAIVVVSTLLCLVERWWLGRDFGVNICTWPQVTALFLYAVNNPDRHLGFIQRLGRDGSMMVYILHPFVWHTLERVYASVGWSASLPALYLLPVLVVIITIILALLYHRVTSPRMAAAS